MPTLGTARGLSRVFLFAGSFTFLAIAVAYVWQTAYDTTLCFYSPQKSFQLRLLVPRSFPPTRLSSPHSDDGPSFVSLPIFMENLAVALLLVAVCLRCQPWIASSDDLTGLTDIVIRVFRRRDVGTQTPVQLSASRRLCIRHFGGGDSNPGSRDIALWETRLSRIQWAANHRAQKLRQSTQALKKMAGFLISRQQLGELGRKHLRNAVKVARDHLEYQRDENKNILEKIEHIGKWSARS